jgi:hypothetical protein
MRQAIILKQDDSVVIQFEGRQEKVDISGNGFIGYDLVNVGHTEYLFGGQQGNQSCDKSSRQPDRLDKIERYLHMLYDAQKVDHAVHQEIDEALKQFKKETGI